MRRAHGIRLPCPNRTLNRARSSSGAHRRRDLQPAERCDVAGVDHDLAHRVSAVPDAARTGRDRDAELDGATVRERRPRSRRRCAARRSVDAADRRGRRALGGAPTRPRRSGRTRRRGRTARRRAARRAARRSGRSSAVSTEGRAHGPMLPAAARPDARPGPASVDECGAVELLAERAEPGLARFERLLCRRDLLRVATGLRLGEFASRAWRWPRSAGRGTRIRAPGARGCSCCQCSSSSLRTAVSTLRRRSSIELDLVARYLADRIPALLDRQQRCAGLVAVGLGRERLRLGEQLLLEREVRLELDVVLRVDLALGRVERVAGGLELRPRARRRASCRRARRPSSSSSRAR